MLTDQQIQLALHASRVVPLAKLPRPSFSPVWPNSRTEGILLVEVDENVLQAVTEGQVGITEEEEGEVDDK